MSFCKCDSPYCTDAAVKPSRGPDGLTPAERLERLDFYLQHAGAKRERPDLDSLAAGIAADILDSDWFRERDARIKAEAVRELAREWNSTSWVNHYLNTKADRIEGKS